MADLEIIEKLKSSGCHLQQVNSIEEIWGSLAYSVNDGFVTGLSLFNLNYFDENFPHDIFELTHLKQLSLYGNHLTKLPNEIYRLEKLQVLDASNNKLTILDQLETLSELTELNLFQNNLTSISRQSLLQLEKLNILYLIRNPVEGNLSETEKLKLKIGAKVDGNGIYVSQKTYDIYISDVTNANINVSGNNSVQSLNINQH